MNKLGVLLPLILLICFSTSCKGDRYKRDIDAAETEIRDLENLPDQDEVDQPAKIAKATFFIENSESMFGYVRGNTNYVDVISELSEKPMFVEEGVTREFNFINGGDSLEITPIGDDPADLRDKLNINGFSCGDPTKSNLNSMFQKALARARVDTISILVSDAIYDIGNRNDPLLALTTEGDATRARFIERLREGGLQTIMIKLHSQFEGHYFPASGGRIRINQIRPFYVWIFGESELLNKYFTEKYIQSLKGYSDVARFLKFDDLKIPFQATSQNPRSGRFRFNRRDKNKLIDVEANNYGEGFKFSFASDFSGLPFSDSYLENIRNYSCTNNYSVIEVSKVSKKIHQVYEFEPTHLITVSNLQSPYGTLDVYLNNIVPKWIKESNTDDDSNIQSDTTKTFGFEVLTEAISGAYTYMIGDENVTKFNFEITQ